MATKYLSTGLLQPNCLDSRSASQVAQQCKPACGYTINQPGLGDSEDECLEKLLQEVDQLRRAGNTRCAAKAFAEGVKLFTVALELKPDATQLLINRAFARIMTAAPALADEDCCLALALKRRLPSAYRWRAAARRDCGWWAGALEDMRMAARMAPTPDKKEAALKEVGKLEEWFKVLEESEAMKKAAEDCRAREAKAAVLAAEAKAAFGRILNERRADLARKKAEEGKWRKEQEAQRKQAEEDIRKQAHNQQVAKMLGKMQRSKNVEVLTVNPKTGAVTNGKGHSADIDSFITFLRPQEACQASGSSTSGSQGPCNCETCRSAVRADSFSSPGHTPGTPSHAGSDAASSARHTMSAPVAEHSRLFPGPKQAQTTSAGQSTYQSTAIAVEEYSSEGDCDGKCASSHEVSNLDTKSTVYNLCGETVTPSEPAPSFYFARRQPCTAGKVCGVPNSATLPDQAAVNAVIQEMAQMEHNARLELGVRTTSNALGEAESFTESHDRAPSSTASAEAAKHPLTASAWRQENAPTVRTKEADRLPAMEKEERKLLKLPREEGQASDQLPRAQEQQLDAGGRADNTSARDHAVHAPSGPAHGISPQASSAADDTEDGYVSDADPVEYPAAQTECVAAPVEQMPAPADQQSAASAAPESRQEPQPQPEAAMSEYCRMPGSEQAETAPASAAAAEDSAVPDETVSEAAWSGNLSKSQKKKSKRNAKLMSAVAAAPAESPLDNDPSPSSEPNTGAPTVAATETSTGNADVVTCTPTEAATDSRSDDGAHAADGEESLREPQSTAGQACPALDSSKVRAGDTDAAATPATNPAAQQAASSFETPDNTADAADTTEAASEVEASLHGAASNHKAQEPEQTSAGTTGTQQGRGLFSALGGWLGMGAKQGAASEASGPLTEEGDYPGREIYMKARAAHRRATERRATYTSQDPTPHDRDLYREAMNLCDQALVVNPAIGQAYLTKAACCMHLDELQAAAEAYANALHHDLDFVHDVSAHAHVDHIMATVKREMACAFPKKDVVMGLLDAAVRLSRSAEWACQTRLAQGEAYLSFGNVQMATNIIFSIFDDEPIRAAFMSSSKITHAQREKVSNLFKDEGNALQKDKDWERAKSLYSLSISANPANAASWSNRAYMNIQLGLYGEAVEDATKVLDITTITKLRDKAHRRRSAAYRELHQLEEAYMDLHDIKRKSDDDFHLIRCLELELVPFAVVQRDAPLVVTKEYRWVNELPAQRPTLDKSGGVMAGRWEPLMDDDAEAGCTKEQLLQRVGMSQKTAETTPATAKTDAPETSGSASPAGIVSGPYSTSSQDSSPATAQTSMPSNGVPSPDAGTAAGQDPLSGTSAAGGDDGRGSRRPSSSYYTAEPGSPLSDASFGSLLSEQWETTAFLPQDGSRRTSSDSGVAVPDPEASPIDTPSDVSNAGDSSDSDKQPSQRPRPRAVPISLGRPSSGSGSNKVISNGRSNFHSGDDGDDSQPDTVSGPASKAEPQECDPLSNLRNRGRHGLFSGELPGRVRVAPSSEASPAGPPKLAPGGPPAVGGGSQWGAQTGDANWRQSSQAVRSGFLNRGLPERQASRPEPAGSSAATPVPEALPPPPPMRGGFFKRRPAGDASHAELPSEPQPQPGQPRVSRVDSQPELCSDGQRVFKGTPEQYLQMKKAAHLAAAGEEAMMKGYLIDAFEAADDAIQLLKQALKPGQTPCGVFAAHLDRAFLLKAMALTKRGRHKDAVDCLTAALKLNKDSHASREGRANVNIECRMFYLAAADLVKLCEVKPPYKPMGPFTTRIITLARQEMAADEQRSARKAKMAARKSSDGIDKPGSRLSTPTTPGSEPKTAERASGNRQRTHEIIMQVLIWIVQNDTRAQMQHASSSFLGSAPSPHMHACRPHFPAHAPRSFYGS